jgi:hypothetical protein
MTPSPTPSTRGEAFLAREDTRRVGAAQHGDGVGAAEAQQGAAHGLEERLTAVAGHVHEVGDNLGVGVAAKLAAQGPQLGLELDVVFDDAIVHDGDVPRDVRVGVVFARLAVGGPARVADARRAVDGRTREGVAEGRELARGAQDVKVRHAIVHGHAGAVIAAVLQPPKALQQDGGAHSSVPTYPMIPHMLQRSRFGF